MGAKNLSTQSKCLYKLVPVTKGNLFVNSASSIEPIWALFLDTTRDLATPQTTALTTSSTAHQNNFLE